MPTGGKDDMMLQFTRETKSDMDKGLVFGDACYVLDQMNIAIGRKVAVIRFAVYASKQAAADKARPIQDSLGVRIEGEQFDALAEALLGDVEKTIQDIITRAIAKQDESPNKKAKITWMK